MHLIKSSAKGEKQTMIATATCTISERSEKESSNKLVKIETKKKLPEKIMMCRQDGKLVNHLADSGADRTRLKMCDENFHKVDYGMGEKKCKRGKLIIWTFNGF